MGYILPVDHYQYNDYHKRVVQEKENKHFIERPFKVILDNRHQEISSKYDSLNRQQQQETKLQNASHALFGELTGKGNLFNDKA
ncbi:hypothetical protein [Oceanobacillus massiliensis]|uniref:hypothetical protein n=1 Tax=Oceanobacillus massiliensis TaxID=1465765 RepID=UPI0002880713|nr:hypothetical protein [Oceanobacillus massiliensis]